MDAIEKRAREVEAALREQVIHHRDLSNPLYMSAHGRLLHQAAEVIAALTPPEGYVLVNADTLQDLASDAEEYVRSTEFRADQIEAKLASVREVTAVLAARPEVP